MILELDLMAGYRIGLAVEEEKAGRSGPLVYTTDEPFFLYIPFNDLVLVGTGTLALANFPHGVVNRNCDDIRSRLGRKLVFVYGMGR